MTQILGGIGVSDAGGGSSSAILGSLTSPRIPYALGAQLLGDDAALIWDAANKKVVLTIGGTAYDPPTSPITPVLHLSGDGASPALLMDAAGQVPAFVMRRAFGTIAAKTFVATGGAIFAFRAEGYTGATNGYLPGGLLRFVANGDLSDTNAALDCTISCTTNGTITAPTIKVRITGAGEGAMGIGTEGLVAIDTALVVRRANPPDIGYVAKFYSNLTCYVQIRSGTGANEQAGFSLQQNTNSKEWRVAVIGNDGNDLRIAGGTGGADVKAYITQNGNLILNDSNIDPATGTKCLILGDGTTPATMDSNSCGLYGDDVSGTVNVFAINEAGEKNQLSGDIKLASGKFFISNVAAFMIKTTTAWTNGAGAGAGTLTNAPAVGNPTKWIPVDDNGTTRYIPAW